MGGLAGHYGRDLVVVQGRVQVQRPERQQFLAESRFPSRSRAIQEAVWEKLDRLEHRRLAQEAAKLDPHFEQQLADEGLQEDFSTWPEY